VQPAVSLYDGAATGQALYTIRNVIFTRVLLGAALYVTLMVFAVDFRDLVRRADAEYEWLGTLSLAAMTVWLGVTLVANGLEGGAALDKLGGSGDPSVVRALTMGYLLIYNGSIAFVMTGLYRARQSRRLLHPRWMGPGRDRQFPPRSCGSWWPASSCCARVRCPSKPRTRRRGRACQAQVHSGVDGLVDTVIARFGTGWRSRRDAHGLGAATSSSRTST
jgi:hypothetical protein